jgi:hypothetical protein
MTVYSIYSQLLSISRSCLLHPQPKDAHHAMVTGAHIIWKYTGYEFTIVISAHKKNNFFCH